MNGSNLLHLAWTKVPRSVLRFHCAPVHHVTSGALAYNTAMTTNVEKNLGEPISDVTLKLDKKMGLQESTACSG